MSALVEGQVHSPSSRVLTDHQSRAFVLCTWLSGFLLLFGLEARYYLMRGEWKLPILFGLAFWYLSYVLFYAAGRFRATCALLYFKWRWQVVRLKPADALTTNFVKSRAEAMRVDAPNVMMIPRTFEMLDGYVGGLPGNPVVVLTGGARAVLTCGASHEIERLALLVDHELAHVRNDDVGTILRAKGIVYGIAAMIPLKLWWLRRIGTRDFEHFYQQIFPSGYESSAAGITDPIYFPRTIPLAQWQIWCLIIGYSAVFLSILAAFYVIIVRRREFWADRVAVASNADAERAAAHLSDMLGIHGPTALPSQSFLGSGLWHPSRSARIANLREADPRSYYGAVSFLVCALVFSARFVFGNNGSLNGVESPKGLLLAEMILISIALYLVTSFLIGCVLFPVAATGRLSPEKQVAERATWLFLLNSIAVTVVGGTVLLGMGEIAQRGANEYWLALTGNDVILKIEFREQLLLLGSLPIAVMALCYGWLRSGPVAGPDFKSMALRAVWVSLAAAINMVPFSLLAGVHVWSARESAYLQMNEKREAQGLESIVTQVGKALPQFSKESEQASENARAQFFEPSFWPPAAMFLLWQGPHHQRPEPLR